MPKPTNFKDQPLTFIFYLLLISWTLITTHPPALAVNNPQTLDNVTNAATIPDSTITAPVLRTPVTDSITNNRYEQFSWTRSTSDTGVSHYTLYLDDLIVSSYITHAPEQDTNQSTATADNDNLYLTLKSPLSEGQHLWYVLAYGVGGSSVRSETKYFTIDTTIPIIILQAVDKNTLYWATNDPFTIPPYKERHLTVTTKNPLLSGKIEANANFKLSLACPQNTTNCQNQSIIINNPDGHWKHRFKDLIPNLTYTAYLSATDAAGNSNIFPEFTITYTPSPLLSIIPLFTQPKISPKALEVGISPSTKPQELTLPTELLKQPPPRPTPPIRPPTKKLTTPLKGSISTTLIYLSLFFLLLHLSLIIFGAGIRPRLTPKLFWILFNPLSKRQPNLATPTFTTLLLYDPNNPKLIYSTISNLQNSFNLPAQPAFLKATHPSYQPYSQLLNGYQPISPITLNSKTSLTPLEQLQDLSLTIRSIPLSVSLLTAIISLILTPNLPALTLLTLSLDLLYTQYLRTQKPKTT